MNIEKKIIKYNFSKRTDTIKYIVIHQTGNASNGAGVDNHFNYFNSGNRNASACYFVDSNKVGQFVEDYNYSWHCGDGKGKYGITNANSIGIEICVNADGDYNKAIENAVELVKHLMDKYKISIDKVVQHYDASRKDCPRELRQGKNGITFDIFKKRIQGLTGANNSFLVKIVNTDKLNVRKGAGTNYPITTTVKRNEVFTIVETSGTWGKLKSGAGWISLNYTQRV